MLVFYGFVPPTAELGILFDILRNVVIIHLIAPPISIFEIYQQIAPSIAVFLKTQYFT
jgi:hypothetical protein